MTRVTGNSPTIVVMTGLGFLSCMLMYWQLCTTSRCFFTLRQPMSCILSATCRCCCRAGKAGTRELLLGVGSKYGWFTDETESPSKDQVSTSPAKRSPEKGAGSPQKTEASTPATPENSGKKQKNQSTPTSAESSTEPAKQTGKRVASEMDSEDIKARLGEFSLCNVEMGVYAAYKAPHLFRQSWTASVTDWSIGAVIAKCCLCRTLCLRTENSKFFV